jgi:hypothetical protein
MFESPLDDGVNIDSDLRKVLKQSQSVKRTDSQAWTDSGFQSDKLNEMNTSCEILLIRIFKLIRMQGGHLCHNL